MPDDDTVPERPELPELLDAAGKVDREALFELYERQGETDEEKPVTVTFKLLKDLEKRLDRYLVDRIPFLSRTALQRLIDEGVVTVNGRVPKASTKLRLGDVIVAVLPPPPSNEIPAEEIPLAVLFEDDDIIVLNKQDDIIVHPARGNKTGTLINALAWHFQHRSGGRLSSVGEDLARPGVVHRLDRHTTGVMVAAKSDTAHWRLGKQFEQRRTQKRYLAVVHGRMDLAADVIDLPLGKHPTVREKYAVRWDETGKPSVTLYRVRERFDNFTLVELDLKTGRTHQIRVHLSHLGYPIVGDDMYGGRPVTMADVLAAATSDGARGGGGGGGARGVAGSGDAAASPGRRIRPHDRVEGAARDAAMTPRMPAAPFTPVAPVTPATSIAPVAPLVPAAPGASGCSPTVAAAGELIARQALHATMLAFRHPISGVAMSIRAPLPADMVGLIRALRGTANAERVTVPGTALDVDALLEGGPDIRVDASAMLDLDRDPFANPTRASGG